MSSLDEGRLTAIVADETTTERQDQHAGDSTTMPLLCPNSTPFFMNFSSTREYNVQFLPTKLCVVSPSRVWPIPTSVVGSKPLCTSMRHWLRMENGTMPLAPRRLPNLGKLEALSMVRLQHQYPIICEFNAVLPVSQSLANQQTLTSGDGGTSLENSNLRASLESLRKTLNLGKPKKGGYKRGSRCIRSLQLDSLRLFLSEKITGFRTPRRRWETGRCKRVAGAEKGGV